MASVTPYIFGVGTVTLTPEVGSVAILGVVQEMQIDRSLATKELRGSKQYPADMAGGAKKITGKIKFAQVNAQALSDLFIQGSTSITGGVTTVTETNQPLGTTPYFMLDASVLYGPNTHTFKLYRCVANKLGTPYKMEDYMIQDFEFEAIANASGQVSNFVF